LIIYFVERKIWEGQNSMKIY